LPWVNTSDMIASSEHLLVPPGSVVSIENHKGEFIGLGTLNPKSPIACRVLTLKREPVDAAFFISRLRQALAKREDMIEVPYYRLIHSEADGLPGLLMDRFGDHVVMQVGTAGMELLQPLWLEALEQVIAPRAVILRNDTS